MWPTCPAAVHSPLIPLGTWPLKSYSPRNWGTNPMPSPTVWRKNNVPPRTSSWNPAWLNNFEGPFVRILFNTEEKQRRWSDGSPRTQETTEFFFILLHCSASCRFWFLVNKLEQKEMLVEQNMTMTLVLLQRVDGLRHQNTSGLL